jgi:hypothetical protein
MKNEKKDLKINTINSIQENESFGQSETPIRNTELDFDKSPTKINELDINDEISPLKIFEPKSAGVLSKHH